MAEADPFPATTPVGRDVALDGLRGLSALAIIAWHFGPSHTFAAPGSILAYVNKALSLTWGGVDVFFVLSGFLIGGTLLRERASPRYYSTFYARRALRILPLYLVVLGVFAITTAINLPALWPVSADYWATRGVPVWSYFLVMQNFFMTAVDDFGCTNLDVTWSLAVEEHFYLLAPLLLHVVPIRRLPVLLIGLIVISASARLVTGGTMGAYVLLPFRMDGLFLGVFLAWLLARPPAVDFFVRRRSWLLGAGVVFFLLPALPLLLSGLGLKATKSAPFGTLLHLWLSLAAAWAVILIRTGRTEDRFNRLLSLAPLRWAGLRAYGIYLLHPWAHHLCFAAFGFSAIRLTESEGLLPTVIAFALSLALAAASWRWLETPFLRFAKRFRY